MTLRPAPLLMIAPTVVLVAGTVAIGVFGGPIYEFAERAAADLLDPGPYLDAVFGR